MLSFLYHVIGKRENLLLAHLCALRFELPSEEVTEHLDALLLGKLLVEDAVVTAAPVLLSDEVGLLPIEAVKFDAVQEGVGIPPARGHSTPSACSTGVSPCSTCCLLR